jgi:ferredoxin
MDDNSKVQEIKGEKEKIQVSKPNQVKMKIDQDVCIRCGSCHITYPDVFEGHDDGTSHPIEGVTVDRTRAEELKLICPVEAIDLEEISLG